MRSKRRRIGRKRRTMKMKGGDVDDPDTKDFMNSKIADLEHKISEMESNIPVQIGYRNLSHTGREIILVEKNISLDDFYSTIHNGIGYNYQFLSLPKVYSLPNVKGFGINKRFFSAIDKEDDALLKARDVKGLDAKYPGMFTDISD